MGTRPYFLNAEVKATVMTDRTLLAMWLVTRDPYDENTDPLHNPDWVAKASLEEGEHLNYLQRRVAQADVLTISPS